MHVYYDNNNDQYFNEKKNLLDLEFKMLYNFGWRELLSYVKIMIFVNIFNLMYGSAWQKVGWDNGGGNVFIGHSVFERDNKNGNR